MNESVYVYAATGRRNAWNVSVGRIGTPLVVVGEFEEALDIGASIATSRKIRTASVVYVQREPGAPLERLVASPARHMDEGGGA